MGRPFREALASGDFLVAVGVDPPKGADLKDSAERINKLKSTVDAIGVSDNHGSMMHMSPWALCRVILDQGAEPIMHVACRDRNRLAIQSDLLASASLGIKNLLCVSGDHIKFGDHEEAKPVHDIDSVHLLEAAQGLNEGQDMSGISLQGSTAFCAGAVANPLSEPIEPQLMKVAKKINAGAAFLVTHPVFDLEPIRRLTEYVKETDVKVLAGVRLLVPEDVQECRAGSYPGLFAPEKLLEEIEGGDTAKCVEIAGSLVKEIRSANLCAGVYISAPGHEEMILDLL